jgi:hypothetical protein
MGAHRRVTEEDLHVTEALISDSFARLKTSIAEVPHEAIRPASNLIREHPFAATAAAAGAGVVAFQLVKVMFAAGGHHKEAHRGRGIGTGIMAQLIPLVAPYITSALQQQLGKALSGEHRQ